MRNFIAMLLLIMSGAAVSGEAAIDIQVPTLPPSTPSSCHNPVPGSLVVTDVHVDWAGVQQITGDTAQDVTDTLSLVGSVTYTYSTYNKRKAGSRGACLFVSGLPQTVQTTVTKTNTVAYQGFVWGPTTITGTFGTTAVVRDIDVQFGLSGRINLFP